MDIPFKLISILCGMLMSAVCSSAEYINPTPGRISIIGSTPIPDGLNLTQDAFAAFAECGFNAGLFNVQSLIDFNEIYNVASKCGVEVIPSSFKLRNDSCENFVSHFKNNYSFRCWNYIDEPHFDKLKEVKKNYDIIKRIDPTKLVMINLIGSPMRQFVGPCTNMTSYLDTIQRIFSPQVWCYDYYPMYVEDGLVKAYKERFYSNLEVFSSVSRKTGVPFWTYLQSMAIKNYAIERPVSTGAYLRYVAFSALGYGAQGILYWTYGQRFNNQYESYSSALVNLDGKKTSAWYDAKQVNHEIIALNKVFFNSRLIDCRHTGDDLYENTKKFVGEFGPLRHLIGGNEGVQVSHLKTNGNDYILIVSHDPFNSQTLRLNFKSDVYVEEISVDSLNDYSLKRNPVNGLQKRVLAPGGYLVFKWDN